MNITPALPNPYHPPAEHERTAVSGVRAPHPTRDAASQAERRVPLPQMTEEAWRERAAEHPVVLQSGESARANRALASYARVADEGRRGDLHDLLGFDAYA